MHRVTILLIHVAGRQQDNTYCKLSFISRDTSAALTSRFRLSSCSLDLNLINMKLLHTASSLLFASLAAAQELTDYTETGVGPQPAGQDYSDAINNPAAQKQVAFSLWDPEDSVAEPPSWSFRTRLAEATIPSEITSIPNARVLNTVYDFQFPNSNNYRDVVAANSGQLNQTSFCVTVLESLLPSGRINAYTEDDSNAYDSCRGPLRDACLESMRKKWMESDWDDAGCRGKDLDLSEIKQCEWTFEGEYEGATYSEFKSHPQSCDKTLMLL